MVTPELPERVLYTENQRLTADDFSDEQAYLAGGEMLHRITQHRWGIVRGLRLEATAGGARLTPGIAVDGFGRQLEVPQPVALAPTEAVDVWLLYDSELTSSPGHVGEPNRVRELVVVRQSPVEGPVDPNHPPLIEPPPPGSSLPVWPVYLGRLSAPPVEVVPVVRRYAAQVGGKMASTDGTVELTLLDEAKPTRKQVSIRVAGTDGVLTPRLTVDDLTADDSSSVTVVGPLTVNGDLRLQPADEPSALRWTLPIALPAGSDPWRAYRVHLVPEDAGDETEEEAEESGETVDEEVSELRFELDPIVPDKPPSERGLAIGQLESSGDLKTTTYRPVLTVTSGGKVVVAGNLIVDGTLTEPPVTPDPRDPRFLPAMNNEWYEGLEAGLVRAAPTLGLDVAKDAPSKEVQAGADVLFGYFAANTGTETMEVTVYDCGTDPNCGDAPNELGTLIGVKTLGPGQVAAFYRLEKVPAEAGEWTTYMYATGVVRPDLTTEGKASLTLMVVEA